ncbi:YwqG family protein [Streptomyces sp. YKOK-I1]
MAELIPEFAALARETTLLYPRSGEPGVRDSSLGGPLLWPVGEPWPHCAQPGHWAFGHEGGSGEGAKPGAVPLVPVLQLFARDVPLLEFPQGEDVVQLLWCALIHDEDPAGVVLPRLYWRNEAETVAAGLLHDVPAPRAGECEDDFVPRPCTVCPTPAVEYPGHDLPDELLAALRPRLEELEDRFGYWYTEAASALQNKVGGYPAWTQPPNWPHCGQGHRMEHLFSITGEPAYGRWLPLDEHAPGTTQPEWDAPAVQDVLDTIGPELEIGDAGGLYVFLCRRCPELPYAHRYDCH